MPRPKKEWTDYPPKFHECLDHFSFGGEGPWSLVLPREDAMVMKTQFYRFFEAVRYAAKNATSEEMLHGSGLARLRHWANQIVFSVRQLPNGDWCVLARVPKFASLDVPQPFLKPGPDSLYQQLAEERERQRHDDLMRMLGGNE